MDKARIAVFASGSGSNAENLIRHFWEKETFDVAHIFCNKADAYVLERAKRLGVGHTVFSKEEFRNPDFVQKLKKYNYIVLAGFLWLVPPYLIKEFPDRIINIHPGLLPKYGGKGMYGSFVHKAVIEAKEKTSGITIHLINEEYDKGKILFQARCEVTRRDDAESLEKKIHELEYELFPQVVEEYITN